MIRILKLFFIALGVFLFSATVVVFGGFWYLFQKGERFATAVETLPGDAEQFAQTHTDSDCVVEAARRSSGCSELELQCLLEGSTFLHFCLDTSQSTPGFCNGIPDDPARSREWIQRECRTRFGTVKNRVCLSLLRAVPDHCKKNHAPSRREVENEMTI